MVGGAKGGKVHLRTWVGWSLIGAGLVVFALVSYVLVATDRDPGGWRLLALPLVLAGRAVKDGFGRRPPAAGVVTAATLVERLPGSDRWRVRLDGGATREVTVPLGWRWRGGGDLDVGVRVVVRSWDDPPSARLLPAVPDPVPVAPR